MITADVRKYAAEPSGARSVFRRKTRRASGKASQQGLAEQEALQKGLAKKSTEFVENGAEVYAKA